MKNMLLTIVAILGFGASLMAQREETIFNRLGMGISGAWGGSFHNATKFKDTYTY